VPTPAPSIDVIGLAKKEYAEAVVTVNKENLRLARTYHLPTSNLANYRGFLKGAAKAERLFADTVRTIVFPADMAGDVKSLLRAAARFELALTYGAKATSWAALDERELKASNTAASAASNLIRADLGLPSIK
jgi:hypothetical protein